MELSERTMHIPAGADTVDAQCLKHLKVWRPHSDHVVARAERVADFGLSMQ